MTEKGCFHKEFDDLIITSGGQQANELSCKVLLNEGDTLICESPSFIGSLNAFRSYNVNLVGVDMDDDGINLEKLENALKTEKNVKILYLIPNFQNPTGRTMSFAKRKAVYELACKYDFIILEDDPYGELRFAGVNVPTIKSLDTEGRVIYSSTFSKLISSGFRTGYCSAPAEIIQKSLIPIRIIHQLFCCIINIFEQTLHKLIFQFASPSSITAQHSLCYWPVHGIAPGRRGPSFVERG